MAGALIVRGERWPKFDAGGVLVAPGDVDLLLRRADGQSIPDKVFLLQQIQYACRVKPDGTPKPPAEIWTCAKGEKGRLDSYTLFLNPGPQWDASGRFTTVNGAVAAPIEEHAVAGRPERWRFVHAGISSSINLQIYRQKRPETAQRGTPTLFQRTAAADQDAAIREACEVDDPIAMFEIAADGLTRPSILEATQRFLHPGYRSDVLVSFEKPGDYCVVDAPVLSGQGIPGSVESRRLLFNVHVDEADPQQVPKAREAILAVMANAVGNAPLKADLKDKVLSEVRNGDLRSFAPHKSLQAEAVDNVQNLQFSLTRGLQSDAPGVPPGMGIGYRRTAPGSAIPPFGVLRYSDNPLDMIVLELGDVDEWRLKTDDVGHPFHIHVNPFEIVEAKKSIRDAAGNTVEVIDLLTQDDKDGNGNPIPSQYRGMKGVFKDTILVAPNVEIVARSNYKRYTGNFVLHCHILYHEDGGMMRKVTIVDPGRAHATLASAHQHPR